MSSNSKSTAATASSGRVLGRLLSREEVQQIGGGHGNSDTQPTDPWVDDGTCTPERDNGSDRAVAG